MRAKKTPDISRRNVAPGTKTPVTRWYNNHMETPKRHGWRPVPTRSAGGGHEDTTVEEQNAGYGDLLAGAPDSLQEMLVWAQDHRDATRWLEKGNNRLGNRAKQMRHIDSAGTTRSGRRWVMIHGQRQEDFGHVMYNAIFGHYLLAEAINGHPDNQEPDGGTAYWWRDARGADLGSCYTVVRRTPVTKEPRLDGVFVADEPLTLREVGDEGSPTNYDDGGTRLALSRQANGLMLWLTNTAANIQDARAAEEHARNKADGAGSRTLRHAILLHPGVSDGIANTEGVYERLGLVIEQLASSGQASIQRDCRAPNQGWKRTPLGTDVDNQYHLWWTHTDSGTAPGVRTASNAVLIRDVREQGDNRKLEAGTNDDYLTLRTAADLALDIAGEPWTPEQKETADDQSDVLLVSGPPGTGKTTALLHAVCRQQAKEVLYITWSRQLAEAAEAHFDSFAASEAVIGCIDFTSLLGELTGRDVPRLPLRESYARFEKAISRQRHDRGSEWKNYPFGLYSEIRGIAIGRSVPGRKNTTIEKGCARLEEDAYRKLRNSAEQIGSRAAKAAWRTLRELSEEDQRAIFPELVAATIAQHRLSHDQVDARFNSIDQIVVDEVQDLTLLETAVVVEIAELVHRRTGHLPKVMLGGDAGQRVRPSGFEWRQVADLLKERVGTPKRRTLDQQLRAPRKLAEISDLAANLYQKIDKSIRPERQVRPEASERVEGHLLHVITESRQEAISLIESLSTHADVGMLTTGMAPAEWIPDRLKPSVLSASEAKGLEYQTTCLIEAGESALALMEAADDDNRLTHEAERTNIDRLRVCMSRATETLVFIDIADENKGGVPASSRLLRHRGAQASADDLLEYLENQVVETEERVERLVSEAERLVSDVPKRAWARACQALDLCGRPDMAGGISDQRLRRRVRTIVLGTIARLALDQSEEQPSSAQVNETMKLADGIGKPLDSQRQNKVNDKADENYNLQLAELLLLTQAHRWAAAADGEGDIETLNRLATIRAALDDDNYWPKHAMSALRQRLRNRIEEGAGHPETASLYQHGQVAGWLHAIGEREIEENAERLAGTALRTLLETAHTVPKHKQGERLAEAVIVAKTVNGYGSERARLAEALGNHSDALKLYEEIGDRDDAIRMLRSTGRWKEAAKRLYGSESTDVEWLTTLQGTISSRPKGIEDRLLPEERKRIEELLTTVITRKRR